VSRRRRHGDDGGGAGYEIEKGGGWLAAVGFGEQLVGDVATGAAQRDFFRLGMRQVDQVGRGLADAEAVDLALELAREIVAAIGARR
jgi:hypothetical protein